MNKSLSFAAAVAGAIDCASAAQACGLVVGDVDLDCDAINEDQIIAGASPASGAAASLGPAGLAATRERR